MDNYSPPPPSAFAQLSNGRFDGDGIDEISPVVCVPKVKQQPKTRQEARAGYKARHPEKYLEQKRSDSRNRRAAKRAAGGTIKASEWRELCDRYGNVCLCCGEAKPLTLDHVLPIAVGGSNTIDNAQPLCALCNSLKGTKYIDYR